jgi:hypothetical protein
LAYIYHVFTRRPVEPDAVQVGPYDEQAGKSNATPETMREAAAEWVREHAEEFRRNVLPYT